MNALPPRPGAADPWEDLRRLAEGPFLVLDTETTGLLAPEVVSIAVIDDRRQTLVHDTVCPAKPMELDAERLTGIRTADLAGRPAFDTIAPRVSAAIRGHRVVIYNADYDVQVLANTYRRYGLALPEFEPWCAMLWFARVYGQWDPARQAFVWQSLRKAAAYFGVEAAAEHDALADCQTTWSILRAGLERSGLRVAGMDALL